MKTVRLLLLIAVLGAVSVVGTAPMASAQGGVWIKVDNGDPKPASPAAAKTVKPNGPVGVSGGCTTAPAKVESSVATFDPVQLNNGSVGTVGKVKSNAQPGTYKVTLTCGKQIATDTLTVAGTVPKKPQVTPKKPQVAQKPVGAPKTGDGSLATTATVVALTSLIADKG